MTPEELAQRVKAGEPGAMLELWECVRRFVEIRAQEYSRRGSVPLDDLIQVGFLAMVDAAGAYEPEREHHSFLSLLSFNLRKRFAKEAGIRTTHRDALQYADSADSPSYTEDPDGPAVVDTIPDDSAALAFMGVDFTDFLTYCRGVIGAALDTLTAAQAAILRRHYLEGQTLEKAAELCGQLTKQAASEAENRGLYRLKHGKYRRELRECLTAFEDFRAYECAAKRERWRETGISRTEAAALIPQHQRTTGERNYGTG